LFVCGVATVLLLAIWPNGKDNRTPPKDEERPNIGIAAVSAIIGPSLSFVAVYRPQYTSYAGFGVVTTFMLGYTAIEILEGNVLLSVLSGLLSLFLISVSVFLLFKRRLALNRAAAATGWDAARYKVAFTELLETPGFAKALHECRARWGEAMRTASQSGKSQSSVDIEALFLEADLLNPILQGKAASWAVQSNGTHHAAPVKGEERAIEKVYRSYDGDWRRLCDLVRTTIVLSSPQELARCLDAIAADPDVELLVTKPNKMHLDPNYNAASNGGYRDVQLSLRLPRATAYGISLGMHIVEV